MSISERYARPLRQEVYGEQDYFVADDPLAKDATRKIISLKAELKDANERTEQIALNGIVKAVRELEAERDKLKQQLAQERALAKGAEDDCQRAIDRANKLALDLKCLEESTVNAKAYEQVKVERDKLREALEIAEEEMCRQTFPGARRKDLNYAIDKSRDALQMRDGVETPHAENCDSHLCSDCGKRTCPKYEAGECDAFPKACNCWKRAALGEEDEQET